MLNKITLILPYYESPLMLKKHLEVICDYPDEYKVIVVDDCSRKPAEDVMSPMQNTSLYRIDTDIAWNREGARNLGATLAKTNWIIQTDIDHIFPVECAKNLLHVNLNKSRWYRFPRYRVGKADDTRKKDAIPEDQEYGEIKPHIDSYLCTRAVYWYAGGYNENYSGCIGGGGPFLKRMKQVAGEPELLLDNVCLQVYTRDKISDASVSDLSRDKTEFKRRKNLYGLQKAENPLRFEWHKVM